MAKASPKQLAWRKKFAAMYGGKGKKRASNSGGGKVASKTNGNGNGKKQGIASWLTSVVAWGIALSNVFFRASDAMQAPKGQKLAYFGRTMTMDYTGLDLEDGSFDWHRMIRGWGTMGGGIVFKKGTTYLVKTAPIKSLIPRIR